MCIIRSGDVELTREGEVIFWAVPLFVRAERPDMNRGNECIQKHDPSPATSLAHRWNGLFLSRTRFEHLCLARSAGGRSAAQPPQMAGRRANYLHQGRRGTLTTICKCRGIDVLLEPESQLAFSPRMLLIKLIREDSSWLMFWAAGLGRTQSADCPQGQRKEDAKTVRQTGT